VRRKPLSFANRAVPVVAGCLLILTERPPTAAGTMMFRSHPQHTSDRAQPSGRRDDRWSSAPAAVIVIAFVVRVELPWAASDLPALLRQAQ